MDQIIQLLDGIKLPFELPLLMHPPIVHFAIALPVIALLLEISNLAIKRRCVGVISGLLITLAGLVYLAAFFTGKTDGSEAYSLLSSEGKEELKEHKTLGIYLVYGIWIVLVLKLIFMAIQKFWAKALFTLILAGFVAAAFIQGKDGGELVYKYGANVKAVSDMDDKIMELEDEIDSLKEKCTPPAKVQAPEPDKKETSQEKPSVKEPKEKQESANQQQEHEEKSHTTETNTTNVAASDETSHVESIQDKATAALKQIKGEVEEKAANTSEEINESIEANTTEQAH